LKPIQNPEKGKEKENGRIEKGKEKEKDSK